jgi:hypothetical protein
VLVRQLPARLDLKEDTMTLTMADSITPTNLPAGYSAYLGYVDGKWPTAATLKRQFPAAHILTLTVLGGNAVADGCDVESGDLTPASGAVWVLDRLAAGAVRPVVYASASVMSGVLASLAARGVARGKVRLLSAHYSAGQHVCGPSTCKLLAEPADGTQWTDSAPGVGGTRIDASLLVDGFFGGTTTPTTPPATSWQETMMHALPTLKEGTSGAQVRTVQGLLLARGCSLTLDGVFGPATAATVERFQGSAHLTADGVVGPHTWPALMDV